jgi:hypothetical protein
MYAFRITFKRYGVDFDGTGVLIFLAGLLCLPGMLWISGWSWLVGATIAIMIVGLLHCWIPIGIWLYKLMKEEIRKENDKRKNEE